MDGEYPLWRLKPEEAARIIVYMAEPKARHLKGEHKRLWQRCKGNVKHDGVEPLIKPKPQNKPFDGELKVLHKAEDFDYWRFYMLEQAEQFPRIGVAAGPFMKDGTFVAWREPVVDHLPLERQREPLPFEIYSRKIYEAEVAGIQGVRSLLMENFILGQRGEGPYMDGIIFKKADDLLLAQIAVCDGKLRRVARIMQNKRFEKRMAKTKAAQAKEVWRPIGNNESTALAFKHNGFTVRRIECAKPYYEVKQ